nr:hypothetical protein HK105_000880 [Polyrhizophydium stewartii]
MRVHVVANTLLLELLERRNHACEDAERTETTRAINMGMQALANMCTANPAVQTLVWPFFAAESQLLSTFLLLAEPAAAKYALVWIHNCTVDSPANCVALVDSTPGADAVASMLKMFSDEADDNDANFNLCFACIKTLLLADLAPRIWTQLDKIEDTDMSNAHVALLKALDGLASPASGARLEARLPLTGRLLAGVLVRTVARMAALMASPDPQLDATTEHFVTFAVLILQFLCAASLVCEPGDKEAWLDAGVVKALLDLLAGVSKLQPAMFGKTRAQPEQVQGNTFFMLKVDIIKVLANLAFESRRVQDLVRRLDGLPLVLSQYLREHALFAVRNLVMGNAENQALVASLEAREVVPNAMLDEMGVHAQVDPRTGKLRFVQPGHAAAAAAAPRGGPAADEGDADGGAASDGGGGGK